MRSWLALLAFVAAPVYAAGGTHIVDDAAVETPGVCNSEAFGNYFGPGRWSATGTLNCTLNALPTIEFGLALGHVDDRGNRETALGPGFKWKLADPAEGPGLALSGAFKIATQTGRIEVATLLVPITFALSETAAFSLNGGWQHVRLADRPDTVKLGAQVEAAATGSLGLMAEVFTTLDKPGAQAGLRWTPGAGAVDVDLTAGHKVDGVSNLSIAAGLVVRF